MCNLRRTRCANFEHGSHSSERHSTTEWFALWKPGFGQDTRLPELNSQGSLYTMQAGYMRLCEVAPDKVLLLTRPGVSDAYVSAILVCSLLRLHTLTQKPTPTKHMRNCTTPSAVKKFYTQRQCLSRLGTLTTPTTEKFYQNFISTFSSTHEESGC